MSCVVRYNLNTPVLIIIMCGPSRIRRLQHVATLERKRLDKSPDVNNADVAKLRANIASIIELVDETYTDKLVRISILISGLLFTNKLTEQIGIAGTERSTVWQNTGLHTETPYRRC